MDHQPLHPSTAQGSDPGRLTTVSTALAAAALLPALPASAGDLTPIGFTGPGRFSLAYTPSSAIPAVRVLQTRTGLEASGWQTAHQVHLDWESGVLLLDSVFATPPRGAMFRLVESPEGWASISEPLPALPGGTYTLTYAINGAGRMALTCDTSPDSDDARAALWDGDEIVDLGIIPGEQQSWAFGISSSGQVIGRAGMGVHSGAHRWHAFVYENGTKSALPKMGGGTSVYQRAIAYDINDRDQIAGQNRTSTWGDFHAVVWTKTGDTWNPPTDLGTAPGGNNAAAQAISPSGEFVAGYSNLSGDNSPQPCLWSKNGGTWTVEPLGSFGGTYGHSSDVTDTGEIVGYALDATNTYRPFYLSESDGTVRLDAPEGYHTYARCLTAEGLVLGHTTSAFGNSQACYWKKTPGGWQYHNLNFEVPLPPGWKLGTLLDVTPDGNAAVNVHVPEAGWRAAVLDLKNGS